MIPAIIGYYFNRINGWSVYKIDDGVVDMIPTGSSGFPKIYYFIDGNVLGVMYGKELRLSHARNKLRQAYRIIYSEETEHIGEIDSNALGIVLGARFSDHILNYCQRNVIVHPICKPTCDTAWDRIASIVLAGLDEYGVNDAWIKEASIHDINININFGLGQDVRWEWLDALPILVRQK